MWGINNNIKMLQGYCNPPPTFIALPGTAAAQLPDMPITTITRTPTTPQGYELVRPFLAAMRTIDKVLGDGNCLFRALLALLLAKQLSGSPDKHMELRGIIMKFEAKNAHVFAKMCCTINRISFAEHIDTRKKVFTWGTTLEILATASLFKVDIFEATNSLTPGKIKWLKYSPIDYENLIGLEGASDFNTHGKSWLEIVYIGSCHCITPLNKDITLTRPQHEVKHYHMDLSQV